MTQEEKAKAYDEAIEKSKEFYILCKKCGAKDTVDFLEDSFPELCEPDDEKIRKTLLRWIQSNSYTNIAGMPIKNIIDWLEKQGEQPKEATYTNEVDTGNGNIKAMVTEKVQLPKFKVKYAGNEYNVLEIKESAEATFYGIEDEPNHIDYVKAENCEIISGYAIKENGSPYPTKPAVFSEQKSQRMVSAEVKEALYDKPTDEEMKELLRTEYEKGRADTLSEMKSSWSEEDEKMVKDIIAAIDTLYYHGMVNWLKSLKDRYTWKPSKVQLECLHDAINHYHANGYPASKLNELYEQISKIYKL